MGLIYRIKRKYKGIEKTKKIFLMLILVSVIPIATIFVMTYHITTKEIGSQINSLVDANLQQAVSNVDNFFSEYNKIITSVYTDEAYVKYLNPINEWNLKEYYYAKNQLIQRLQTIAYNNRNILGAAIVGKNSETVFFDKLSYSVEESYCFDNKNMRFDFLYQSAMGQRKNVYESRILENQTKDVKKNCIYIAHQLIDFNNIKKGPVGCLILCIDEEALNALYGADEQYSGDTFMVSGNGKVISHNNKALIGTTVFENTQGNIETVQIEGYIENYLNEDKKSDKHHIVNVKQTSIEDFYIVNVREKNKIMQKITYISTLICLIGIITGIVCLIITLTFYRQIQKSVTKIISGMESVNEDNYDVHICVDGEDEFNLIARHFNDMVLQIKNSKQQKEKALLREKNAEIRALEAQINPHFIYNTLDAINWVAISHEEYSISKMLNSLAIILRYNISNSNEIVSLREEITYLKKYIFLQQQRFDYSFLCRIDMKEELYDCKIHKLMIQPVIENSIIHGFPGTTGNDEILIEISRENESELLIKVTDNGNGMNENTLKQLNEFDIESDNKGKSIGLRNVIMRLKLYYGEKGNLCVQSKEGKTVVLIKMPCE